MVYAVDTPYADVGSVDHTVKTVSISPSLKGTPITLFVHERIRNDVLKAGRKSTNGKVVLFVHGGTFPSVPDFDLSYQDYSWMAYLAEAGFDVFSIDMTGYGKSSRPHMDDPCNAPDDQQAIIGVSCPPSFPQIETTPESDWSDLDAVVDFIRKQTGAAKINLVGWSGGGPRVGGYTALHGDKVARVVFLAPAYIRAAPDTFSPPPNPTTPMVISTRERAAARWDQAVKCQDQYDPAIRDVIWNTNMAFDDVGAKWGPGVVRAPRFVYYGWNQHLAPKFSVPVLMFSGELDVEVKPDWVKDLYADISSKDKVFVSVACGSHYIVYERGHRLLLEGSKEWFLAGTFHGVSSGVLSADVNGNIAKVDADTQSH
jgi:pimeloyl-ACP methyl ester carboxylesterase